MKHSFLMAAGSFAALIATDSASATYTGLSTQFYTTVDVGGGPKSVYRVYANFTDANDHLHSIKGDPAVGALVIKSLVFSTLTPGPNFFNPGGVSSKTAPATPDGMIEWGTFATIGVSLASQGSGPSSAPDQTMLLPGFPDFINGNSLTSTNIGWFTAGPQEQGRAGYLGDGDPQLRVLIMQLTVDAGYAAAGTVTVTWSNSNGMLFQSAGQTFSIMPAPAGLAAMALGAVVTPHRRRRL